MAAIVVALVALDLSIRLGSNAIRYSELSEIPAKVDSGEGKNTPALLEKKEPVYDKKFDGWFCANHYPCDQLQVCKTCLQPTAGTPHFFYSHVEKTGGSSLECAWQEAHEGGNLSLLGHASWHLFDECAYFCAYHNVTTRRLITVREPYRYWQSMYQYAWKCIFGDCGSAESLIMKWDYPEESGVKLKSNLSVLEQQGVLRSFEDYLHFHSTVVEYGYEQTQHRRIHKVCGDPCPLEDFEILRTEKLEADYDALLTRYPGLPQVKLPKVNQATFDWTSHPWGKPPPAKYTPELLLLVQKLDGWVFDNLHYTREYDLESGTPRIS